jgi:hypothetical protein
MDYVRTAAGAQLLATFLDAQIRAVVCIEPVLRQSELPRIARWAAVGIADTNLSE